MVSVAEQARFDSAMRRASELYGNSNLPPHISEQINFLTFDLQWLLEHLNSAWALVELYQLEIMEYKN